MAASEARSRGTAPGPRPAAHVPAPPRPVDVLGAPTIPPPALTRLVILGRSLLARLHRASAPPPSRIMEAALAGLSPAVLATLCHLDVPDRVTAPVPVADLAVSLDVDPDRLERLLRFAHVHGWIRLDRAGRVRPTRVTAFLRRDHPGGWRAWAVFAAQPEVTRSLGALTDALKQDGDGFRTANQQPFFPWMAAHPDAAARFDEAMAAGARMHGLLLARAFDWSARRRVCDVGGGDGTVLAALVAHHPHLDATVLELPEVVARTPDRPGVTALAGDAFDVVPTGFDTYLLVNVVHDWSDRDVKHLLEQVTAAARASETTTAAVQIVVVESRARPRPVEDIALSADTLMLALTPGGRERTVDELTAIGRAAGLSRRRWRALASGDVAIVFEPTAVDETRLNR